VVAQELLDDPIRFHQLQRRPASHVVAAASHVAVVADSASPRPVVRRSWARGRWT
jgi:hypothetical protein